jgi:hypothetical protein
MVGDDGSEWYMLGFATGVMIGVAIAYPGRSTVVISLEQDELAALREHRTTEEQERHICDRVLEAFADRLDSQTAPAFLCESVADDN